VKISMRDKLALTAIALVVVLALVIGFLVVPQLGTMAGLDGDIEGARKDVGVQLSLLNQREAMKDQAAQTDAKALTLGSLVPDRPDLPSLIIELQDIAFAAGVKLAAITPDELTPSDTGSYIVIPLDMVVQGTWTDTVDFLQRIPRLTRGIRTVEFTSIMLDEEEGTDDFSPYSQQTLIKLEAYSVPSTPTSGTTPPAPVPAQ